MRSVKRHWTPGKVWVFYWDEMFAWVVMNGDGSVLLKTFAEAQELVNSPLLQAQVSIMKFPVKGNYIQ